MIMDNFDSPFLYNRPSLDVEGVKKAIVYKLIFLIGRSPKEASQRDWLNATLHAVRDLVTEGWITTARQSRAEETRRVYYLSMEFLIGRTPVSYTHLDVYKRQGVCHDEISRSISN